jgi:hypothetical protein
MKILRALMWVSVGVAGLGLQGCIWGREGGIREDRLEDRREERREETGAQVPETKTPQIPEIMALCPVPLGWPSCL